MDRIDYLRRTHSRTKFLSCEPLIGPLPGLNLKKIDWVIVGGESGRTPRPIEPEWVLEILNTCEDAGVEFFFKQWGGISKKKSGRKLNAKYYNGMPSVYQ